ncbi:MAG: nitrate reductase [Desulfosalsimonas sp.]|uniref:TmcC family electron transfer complex membrane anchor subunit n=1 Tax=Desulfosalsimonas sp. TaxID=3073848 RepID=UPI00397079EA
MHELYKLASGIFVWIAILGFAAGMIGRLAHLAITARKKDPVVYQYFSLYYALRSILHWIIPFASTGMRAHPVITIVAFVFHTCLIVTPLFAAAHVILVMESWNVSWWHLPDPAADVMTVLVILGCLFFLIRRIVQENVRYLSTPGDFVLIALVAAPFVTGFWTYHQLYGYEIAGILHMLSGELVLLCLPFTRLFHMALWPFTRAYAGSEFGGLRRSRDW